MLLSSRSLFENYLELTNAYDLVKLKIYYTGEENPSEYVLMKQDVRKMLKATLQLHWKPGVDPHNGRPTRQVEQILVCSQNEPTPVTSHYLVSSGPFWWSTPGLKTDTYRFGARLYENRESIKFPNTKVLWVKPV
jgi:hypothetical protein